MEDIEKHHHGNVAYRPQPLTRDRRSVARVGDDFFGDSVLEGGPKQRQCAAIGMTGLGL
jgi:hypothetical protein